MRAPRSFVVLLLAAALLMSGCETSFAPFAESDLRYAVFGYLDASADTQWVRVEPLQDSLLVGTQPFEAQVTTTNLATGEATEWQREISELSDTLVAQVYWTTTDFEPRATYRFAVEGERGTTTAEVTLPSDFPEPLIIGPPDLTQEPFEPTTIIVRGVARLGAVIATYNYTFCFVDPGTGACTEVVEAASRYPYLDRTTRRTDGTYEIIIDWASDLAQSLPQSARLLSFDAFSVTVANVSEDWPDYDFPVYGPGDPTPPQPPVPGLESNIENGTGYLGGTVTQTVNVPIFRGEQSAP